MACARPARPDVRVVQGEGSWAPVPTKTIPNGLRTSLRIVEDSSYEEIAAVLGISVNTAKSHLHQAKRLLRQKLQPYFGEIEI